MTTFVALAVVECVPPFEERREFVMEVVGGTYLNGVMTWYQPSFSDPLIQKHPVVVLYYPNGTSLYSDRKSYYQQPSDFVAAGGDIVDTSKISEDLSRIWSSYIPLYDIDVWLQPDMNEWQAEVKGLSKISLEGYKFFLIRFTKET